ncbi:MAG TPA: ABC transporter permease, partial [Dermatophilaceae bacterium]|nr:ABC transporter permease [Dermatophilaceae bacterium]
MTLRLVERIAVLAASLAVSSILVFGFMVVLPGDPARVALGVNASEQSVASLRGEFGLDRPLVSQYLSWAGGFLRLHLGDSYISRAPIGPQVADRLQVSLWLVLTSMVIAVLIAVPVGSLMAVWHRRVSGLVLSAFSQVGVAVPAFLAGILFITVFAVKLGWLPANGWTPPAQDPAMFLRQLALPAVSLGLVQAAVLARYVRSSVLDVLREDYLRTARAKGLRPMPALLRHGLRNASVPVITVLGLQLATLLIGAVVVERVFVIPGLGSL